MVDGDFLSSIFEMALPNGVFAALFVWLFYSVRQESSQREERLLSLIESYQIKLSEISEILSGIKSDISNLSDKVNDIEHDVALE